jgi:sterol desaturase/sphingolipid hydroxylase (fatty acid hydroxylase superfamily)
MLHLLSLQISKLSQAGAMLLSPATIFSLPQLAVAFALATGYLAWRQHRRHGRIRPRAILRALLASRRLLFSRSTVADLFYYLVNTFAVGGLIGWGLFSGGVVSHLVVHALTATFGARTPSTLPGGLLRAGLTATAFLGYEFGYYLDHYCKHKIPLLWELHKTHHTAEVLTPFTLFRVHPLDTLIFVDIVALSAGLLHGAFTYAAGKSLSIFLIGGSNVISVAFFFLLAHLQHSQFWIPLRGLPGRLLLSPAHHQIHHSLDPAHYNTNFGSFLAVFDWMFGTLSIPPQTSPRLRFGVAQPGTDPHRISTLLLTPLGGALALLARRAKQAPQP